MTVFTIRLCVLALLLVPVGCRCGKREPPSDLLEILPEQAVFVMNIDLPPLRKAPALASLMRQKRKRARYQQVLGFDPTRDLHRVVVAAAGRGRELDYLVLMVGRFSRDKVVAAISRQSGKFTQRSRRGYTVFQDRSGLGPRLIFPGRQTIAVVSPGWERQLLRRLAGLGRTVFEANPPLGTDIRTIQAGRSTWLVSRLANSAARYLARRFGWPELEQLGALQGGLTADHLLHLNLVLSMEDEVAAEAIKRRVVGMAHPERPPADDRRKRVQRRGLRVIVDISVGLDEIGRFLAGLRQTSGG